MKFIAYGYTVPSGSGPMRFSGIAPLYDYQALRLYADDGQDRGFIFEASSWVTAVQLFRVLLMREYYWEDQ